jgi:hypothetical protein
MGFKIAVALYLKKDQLQIIQKLKTTSKLMNLIEKTVMFSLAEVIITSIPLNKKDCIE